MLDFAAAKAGLSEDVDPKCSSSEGTANAFDGRGSSTDSSFWQLLQEVETQAMISQQKIGQTQGEISSKKREARLNQLTSNELASLSKDTKVYEGVGKMYVEHSCNVQAGDADCYIGSSQSLLTP